MTLELHQLRQVVALAEHRSFVRAAAALHISQPALSRSIQQLERRFGGPLFVRTSTGVVATDMGRLYIERSRELLRMADELEGEALSHTRLRAGRVDVGGGPYPSDSLLSPACVRFMQEYPRVMLRLQSGDWDQLEHLLRSRALDFFVAETSLLVREPDLEVVPLPVQHPIYFFARAGHPLANRTELRSEEAFEYPIVTPSRIPPRVLDPMLSAHRAGSARQASPLPFPALQCNGLSTMKRIVATSDAFSASTLICIEEELDSGRFVLLATEPWMVLQYGIVSLAGRPWTQTAAKLRDLVLEAEQDAVRRSAELLARHGARVHGIPRERPTEPNVPARKTGQRGSTARPTRPARLGRSGR